MKSIKYLLILLPLLFVIIQCKKETPEFSRPEVTTGEYNPENGTAIGTIKHLSEYVMEYGHIWGTIMPTLDTFVDRTIHTDITLGDSVQIVSTISGLQADETYFIRSYVTDEFENTWYGDVVIQYSPSDYIKACLTSSHTECEIHQCGVHFDASCSVGVGITTYKWDFNGDNVFDYIGDSPIADYNYTTAGTYYPRLYILSDRSFFDDTIFTLQVFETEQTLIPCFLTSDTLAVVGTTIDFDASCSPNAVYYEWDFDGDGLLDDFGTEAIIGSYTYNTPGDFTAKLTVKNDDNITATDSIHIKINPLPPIIPTACFFASITEAEAGKEIEFYASCSEDALIYRWDFDGDGDFEMGGTGMQTVTHVFDEEGVYNVRLEVVSVDNITHSDTITITINSPTLIMPEACVSDDTPTIAQVDETIYFDASCSQDAVNYKWNFGDGTILNGIQWEVASYAYDEPGDYTFTLTVESIDGETDSDTHDIEVTESAATVPLACIESDIPSTVEIGETIYFDASCSENAVNYKWDFGDGTILNGSQWEVASHAYDAFGEYPVTLIVRNSDGEEDELDMPHIIQCNTLLPEEYIFTPDPIENLYPILIAADSETGADGPFVEIECNVFIFNDNQIYLNVYCRVREWP